MQEILLEGRLIIFEYLWHVFLKSYFKVKFFLNNFFLDLRLTIS